MDRTIIIIIIMNEISWYVLSIDRAGPEDNDNAGVLCVLAGVPQQTATAQNLPHMNRM